MAKSQSYSMRAFIGRWAVLPWRRPGINAEQARGPLSKPRSPMEEAPGEMYVNKIVTWTLNLSERFQQKCVARIPYLYRTRIAVEFNFEFGFKKSNLMRR